MRLPRFLRAALWLAAVPVAFAITDRDYSTNPLMQNEVRTLKNMLDYVHFNRNGLRAEDYPKLITDYMALLDPQRLYFTAGDEQSLRRLYGTNLENNIAFSGNIDAAFRIYGLFEQRVGSRVTWVHAQLAKDIDLASDETYTIDRSKSPWPADQAEADSLWSRRLKAELINELLNKKTPEAAKATMAKRFDRFLKNTSEVHPDEIEARFLTAFTRLYDPHSSYFSATDLEDFNVDINLHLVGIGAVLTVDEEGYCKIVSIVPGGPADLTGKVKPNDKIVAVQQDGQEPVDVVGMRNKQIVQMIRGAKGTKVTLSIIPQKAVDQSKTEQVAIVRDVIKINQARASAELFEVPDATGKINPIGVITLNSFYGENGDTDEATRASASNDVAELIEKLKKENLTALVLDLRRNGGGLLSEAINLSGLFIEQGPVVQVRDSAGRVSVGRDTNRTVAYDGPLAILTSRFSASASEIFAGAMQNYGRAVIIGDSSTYGKGTVQVIFEMSNYLPKLARDYGKAGAAKLTTQKYYLPNGSSTQKKGVIPDIVLPSVDDYIEVGEATEPNALIWDEISTAPFEGKPLNQAFVGPLLAASKHRQDSLEEFSVLKQNIDWFRQRTEQKTISLNLEKRRAEKTAIEATGKKFDTEFIALAKNDFAKHEVKLDAVIKNPPPPEPTPTDGDTDADDADHVAAAKFDVHLRETLRVVSDAVRLADTPLWAKRTPMPAPSVPRG
ncbi:MAG: carboxy terminal-processing peptidase [Opitutae bacterium]|nr:carboxy terminal-processing peptidase [Opitutae bacterium]